ncbi:hypothetical protein F5141DRAFT_1067047 [Pisolithus sp. B1]|nr:hypothetical protein F5141DRAFT_1067047 [Pisolithus sp. B1]
MFPLFFFLCCLCSLLCPLSFFLHCLALPTFPVFSPWLPGVLRVPTAFLLAVQVGLECLKYGFHKSVTLRVGNVTLSKVASLFVDGWTFSEKSGAGSTIQGCEINSHGNPTANWRKELKYEVDAFSSLFSSSGRVLGLITVSAGIGGVMVSVGCIASTELSMLDERKVGWYFCWSSILQALGAQMVGGLPPGSYTALPLGV